MADDFNFSNGQTHDGLERELNQIDTMKPAEMEAHVYEGGVEVTHLVVSGPARSRGVASGMIEEVVQKSRSARSDGLNVQTVTVTTQGGDAAQSLLRSMNFHTHREAVDGDDDIVTGVLEL